jgi:hypothetical protein
MANLTTLYLERQLCKMNEMNRLREKGIDLKDATQPFLQWDQLDSLPPVSAGRHWALRFS